MQLKHNNDRVAKRILPWTLTVALVGILYHLYLPYNTSPATSPQNTYHTASEVQSLTYPVTHFLEVSSRAEKKQLLVRKTSETGDGKYISPAIKDAEKPTANVNRNAEKIIIEERTLPVQDTTEDKNLASNQNKSSTETDNPTTIRLSRGEFEKHVLHIGATSNAWRSLQHKDIDPAIMQQLAGLKKRLLHSFKSVDVLYSNYVHNGKIDSSNSKLLAVRTDKWSLFCKESHGEILFYDAEGNASESSMDRVPLNYTRISSPFNMRRLHPITHRIRPHTGVDLKGAYGAPIASTGKGVVTFAGWQRGYGRIVIIKHDNGYETRYAHLSAITTQVGANVKRGQIIGKLGNSGASTGAHIHFEVRVNGTPYNPMTVKLPSYKPLHQQELTAWKQYAKIYTETIENFK